MTEVPAGLENEGGISYLEALAESMSEPEGDGSDTKTG